MPQVAPTSVKFYTLSTMPNMFKNGTFLNLTNQDHDNKAGLYFCDGTGWRYLINLDTEIKSALVYDNVMYFYTVTPAPTPSIDTVTGNVDLGDYSFSVQLPEWLSAVVGGNGISVSGGDTISVDLAPYATLGTTPTPHTGSDSILIMDSNNQLSISDTWKCGHYDDSVQKHLSHLISNKLVYKNIRKAEIPDGVTVTQVSFVDSNPSILSPEYIQDLGNNWYYKLVGSKPLVTSLVEGEIAISNTAGFERLYIKNTNDEIVEFRPAGRLNTVYNATFTNPVLTPSNSVCTWEIPYADIILEGIGVTGAMVVLRDSTGRQLVPDVLFDSTNQKVVISIYSASQIPADEYTAIVMGSNYNDTH